MIEITDKLIGEIPVLELVMSELRHKKLPIVVFYHGWTNVKERVLTNGYEIARKGIRVIIPEALYHGKRSDGQTTEAHFLDFWKIVLTNVAEFPQLIEHYQGLNLSNPEKVGVSGLSMGGITTAAIMATQPTVKAANVLMGAPNIAVFCDHLLTQGKASGLTFPQNVAEEFAKLAPFDLGAHPEKIAGRPLHFWHGRQDQTVPFENSADFYQAYNETVFGKNISYTATDDSHRVPHHICLETANFFEKYLID